MYEIEKGVVLPIKKAGRGSSLYPYRDMEIGDSFFVKVDEDKIIKKRSAILASLRKERTGMVFTTRKVKNGIRTWRIE